MHASAKPALYLLLVNVNYPDIGNATQRMYSRLSSVKLPGTTVLFKLPEVEL